MLKKLSLMIFFICIALYISFIPSKETLSFYDARTKERIAFLPLDKSHSFSIQYTHSIHLSIVEETYELTDEDEIRQIELMYEDFAIGMPSHAEGNERFVQENGKYYIKNMNRTFPEIVLRVGEVSANHQLLFEEKALAMTSFTSPGSVLRIKYSKLNMWEQMKGVNIFDRF
ncbi:DUF1850 domain-containing protein [Bacillus sp. AGMB 02131]|uniref:DUF1850 domain-containing protein n=2 Tax=Peribacillus faecalis TaxID=2772559 RepID=A0A927CYH7_9BACI|nr:DUF1850 domain-containing protein [Peribacillus faecalis]